MVQDKPEVDIEAKIERRVFEEIIDANRRGYLEVAEPPYELGVDTRDLFPSTVEADVLPPRFRIPAPHGFRVEVFVVEPGRRIAARSAEEARRVARILDGSTS